MKRFIKSLCHPREGGDPTQMDSRLRGNDTFAHWCNTKFKIIFIIILMILLYTCHHHKTPSQNQVITVSKTPNTSVLYYSGIIQPLKIHVITSPTDGVINEMSFHFGDEVTPGQPLFLISSDKFQADYKAALMEYIKAKTEFSNAQTQMREATFLHNNQLISDDDYKTKKTNYYNAQLAMLQAKDTLDKMLKQLDLHGLHVDDVKIENIEKINQLLNMQNEIQQIKIVAPTQGVILLPNKNESDGELKKINKGDQIKLGDLLAVIGDVSGLTIHINVSEFNINQLKVGQKVEVTGAAFPDLTLLGQISAINHQGEVSQGGLPTFSVEVIVPKLTKEEMDVIHMGMSAKVAIEINGQAEIAIPIKAVMQHQGETYVNVQDEKTGKIKQVVVKTGQTSLDSVVITANLVTGEKIVIPH